MITLQEIARIAEIEFSGLVESTEYIGFKLRIVIKQDGFIDVWLSRKIKDKFSYHWEVGDGSFYRYDNFPDSNWKDLETFPFHFHDGYFDNIGVPPGFSKDVEGGFRDFMDWVNNKLRV
ncbi:hypothetical protein JXI42_09625 [bacterium]|nr:hypothetical protein [bacterium]